MVRSYAAGFIFTTSLPLMVLAGAQAAVGVLASAEGRLLRKKHQENDHIFGKNCLLPIYQLSLLHLISYLSRLVVIGNPNLCSKISDLLLQEKGHYVQAINYPTVPIGEKKLRLASTPHHTAEMVDILVADMLDVWV
ncbi:Pyridoxal phosphate-dependent transferase, subdomain 2,Aminotransferase, class I/classII,Pyridoxal [Cinara cedri]|uniref:Pyridoxal phosphate-dependent transferase, subdomain 2,Aminotransferase, class I/classII,Pyridoxal n=1 Tax=Cinara cedri TaxID=506608 RepID=A0A5E4NMK4_9HEMI|nr:Pyridoxal phosphate-dependent transferase, subdomain 2,Aminotransferase, class I/classII,Pyridoxal [Cinara cedri]